MRKIKYGIFCVLSFILGSTVTLLFVTVDDNNKFSSIFGHNVSHLDIRNRYFLIIIILCNPDDLSIRNTIRETWLQFVEKDETVKHFFVMGTKALSSEKVEQITSEQQKHGDILPLVDLQDSYKELTRKLLTSLIMVEKQFKFKFILKCDIDSFVHAADVVKELKTKLHTDRLYWGYFNGRAHVFRNGKYKEDNWFLCDRYLPYAVGGGYVLSHLLVEYISKNADLLSIYVSEDVSVGTWLSPLDINRIHDPRFDTEFESRGCSNSYLITHKHSEKSMRHLYSETVTHGRMCVKEIRKRPSYIYNWDELPSKCCKKNNYSVI